MIDAVSVNADDLSGMRCVISISFDVSVLAEGTEVTSILIWIYIIDVFCYGRHIDARFDRTINMMRLKLAEHVLYNAFELMCVGDPMKSDR